MLGAFHDLIDHNQMLAYLVMMAARLVELHRVLKPTGSLYLHCDLTASHYLKLALDTIFGVQNFRNEIIWKRTAAHSNVGKRYGIITDSLFFYTKSSTYKWNQLYVSYSNEHINNSYRYIEENTGRRYASRDITASMQRASSGQLYDWKGIRPPPSRCWVYSKSNMEKLEEDGLLIYSNKGYPRLKIYLDEMPGTPLQNLWDDILPIQAAASERLGYPTQKPLALLERIIQASSNPGDIVLDPFSGCGTCIAASQTLGRQWIGIDITHLAIAMHKSRLKDMFGLEPKRDYQVIGEPEDLSGARQLAAEDRYQFQWWALSLIEARPLGGEGKKGKKGSDRGVDGVINFLDDRKGGLKRALVQVKSGHVKSGDIRDLKGTLEREGAQIGVFITLEAPTRDMLTEALTTGSYHSEIWNRDYPKIQILSIEELLNGAELKIPQTPSNASAYKKAEKVEKQGPKQVELDI